MQRNPEEERFVAQTAEKPLVGIIMGSKSDMPTMEACTAQLDELGVPYELVIASAHRNPEKVHEWASSAADRGLKVIIAADLGGMDSLLSMVQMPSGVPVACVAINGAKNAAIFATQILGATMPEYRQVIVDFKQKMAEA